MVHTCADFSNICGMAQDTFPKLFRLYKHVIEKQAVGSIFKTCFLTCNYLFV